MEEISSQSNGWIWRINERNLYNYLYGFKSNSFIISLHTGGGSMSFKDNPVRWKYGHAKYFFHTPLEYEIIEKGDKISGYHPNIADDEIKIRPVSIGRNKSIHHTLFFKGGGSKVVDIRDYPFWIPRRRIRRGARSWSQKKDRWVHKKTFNQCLARALRGQTYYVDYY